MAQSWKPQTPLLIWLAVLQTGQITDEMGYLPIVAKIRTLDNKKLFLAKRRPDEDGDWLRVS